MPVKTTLEDGTEYDAPTAEEIAAKDTEIATAKADAETARAEATEARRVAAEQTQNFKKVNEMSAEDKARFTAEQLEIIKRAESAEAKAVALETQINTDTTKRIDNDKANALAKYHGGNTELKKKLEENYAIINIEGTDTETINKRAKLAADMIKGDMGFSNPLFAHMNGGSPRSKDHTRTEEFLKSEKGQKAAKLMGLEEEKK